MDIDETIAAIRRNRQAFAFGVEGVQALYHDGTGDGGGTGADRGRMEPMPTNIVDEMQYVSPLLPERIKLNSNLKRAASNQLAMQLVVGIYDPIEDQFGDMANHQLPILRFLRLLRNGIAHGNEVSYTDADPRENTVWRGFEFKPCMGKDRLFTQPVEFAWDSDIEMDEGYFQAGDAFALTTDILGILIEGSDTFDEGNITDLSKNSFPEWDGI